MSEQRWRCDLCKAEGRIEVSDGETLWTVFQRILDAHRDVQAGVPDCNGGRETIRVFIHEKGGTP